MTLSYTRLLPGRWLICLLLLAPLLGYGQEEIINRYRPSLQQNKISSMRVYERKYNNDPENKKKGSLVQEEYYHPNGYIKSDIYYIDDKEVKFDKKREFFYDSLWNRIFFGSDPLGNIYNETGLLVKRKGKNREQWEYKYDEKGNLAEQKWFYMFPNYYLDKYEYNASNQRIRMNRYDRAGTLFFRFDYYYDEKGNETRTVRFEKDDTTDVTIRQFDAEGRETSIEKIDYNREKKKTAWSKTFYHSNGLIDYQIVQLPSANGPVIRRYEYDRY